MRVCVTITGPSGCGKTLLAESLEQFARERAYGCPVEWRMFEGNGQNFFEEHRVFTIPADQGDGAVRPSGDRGDYAVVPREDGYFYVEYRGQYVAAALAKHGAERMMLAAASDYEQRKAIDAILERRPVQYNGDTTFEHTVPADPENCRGGGGDFADLPGVISAATAPAIHDMRFAEMHRDYADQLADGIDKVLRDNPNMSGHDKTELRHARQYLATIAEQGKINYRLALAARRLYNAGCWTLGTSWTRDDEHRTIPITPEKQAAMWAELRDALGLEEGTATAAGIGAELPEGPGADSEKPCFMYGNAFDGTLGFAPTPTSGKQGSLDRIVKLEQENEDLRHDLRQSREANARMASRNENQRQTLEDIWDFLALLADVFDAYAANHDKKARSASTFGEREAAFEKAARNRRYARMCRQRIPHGTADTIAEILNQPETEAA